MQYVQTPVVDNVLDAEIDAVLVIFAICDIDSELLAAWRDDTGRVRESMLAAYKARINKPLALWLARDGTEHAHKRAHSLVWKRLERLGVAELVSQDLLSVQAGGS